MDDCIFCKIVKGTVPSTKVYEDEEILVFRDIKPHAPVHVLIIPKTHIESLAKAHAEQKELLGNLLLVAKKVAVQEGVDEAYKVVTNSGAFAGQVVMHLHLHLLGGWKKKGDVVSELIHPGGGLKPKLQ